MKQLTINRALLIWGAIILLVAVALHFMGRSFICPCGTVKFFDVAGKAGQDSQHILDWYSFTHVLHGLLFYMAIWLVGRGRVPFALGLVLAVMVEGAWEIFENSPYIVGRYQESDLTANYKGDAIINSIGDMLSMSLGFLLAWRLPVLACVAIFVGVEVGLALYIRDNLFISTLGLIYQFDWIAEWQAGVK